MITSIIVHIQPDDVIRPTYEGSIGISLGEAATLFVARRDQRGTIRKLRNVLDTLDEALDAEDAKNAALSHAIVNGSDTHD